MQFQWTPGGFEVFSDAIYPGTGPAPASSARSTKSTTRPTTRPNTRSSEKVALASTSVKPTDSTSPEPVTHCDERCPWKLIAPLRDQPFEQEIGRPDEPNARPSPGVGVDSIYQPLQSYQTRLIALSPGVFGDPLICRLMTVDLLDMEGVRDTLTSTVIHYSALSYSWGYDEETCIVDCNDFAVPINANLASALRNIRQTDGNLFVWCDALCINQNDLLEKAHQVRNMMRIFEKAERVLAWLGLEESNTKLLFTALSDPNIFKQQPSVVVHQGVCSEGYGALLTALEDHFRRPWFSRAWVRQEVFAARAMTVICGQWSIDFVVFIQAAFGIRKPQDLLQRADVEELVSATSFLRVLESNSSLTNVDFTLCLPGTVAILNKDFQHTGLDSRRVERPPSVLRYSTHWLRSLDEGAMFKATYDVDRVYALLGIMTSRTNNFFVEDHERIGSTTLPIDYNKNFSEVAQDVVKYLINTERNLDVLGILAKRPKCLFHLTENMPSWIVDWRTPATRSFPQRPPRRSLEAQSYGQAQLQDYNETGVLRLKGFRFGTKLSKLQSRKLDENDDRITQTRRHCDANCVSVIVNHYVLAQVNDDKHEFLVPSTSMIGDFPVIFEGGPGLFILRESDVEGRYWLGGVTLGLMDAIPSMYKNAEGNCSWSTVPAHKTEEFILI